MKIEQSSNFQTCTTKLSSRAGIQKVSKTHKTIFDSLTMRILKTIFSIFLNSCSVCDVLKHRNLKSIKSFTKVSLKPSLETIQEYPVEIFGLCSLNNGENVVDNTHKARLKLCVTPQNADIRKFSDVFPNYKKGVIRLRKKTAKKENADLKVI